MTTENRAELGGCLGLLTSLTNRINSDADRLEERIELKKRELKLTQWVMGWDAYLRTSEGLDRFIRARVNQPFDEAELTIALIHGAKFEMVRDKDSGEIRALVQPLGISWGSTRPQYW